MSETLDLFESEGLIPLDVRYHHLRWSLEFTLEAPEQPLERILSEIEATLQDGLIYYP